MKKKLAKLYFKLREKTTVRNGMEIKYIEENDKNSDTLILIFSAFPREGMEATYNYIKTLKGIKANKLFLLDHYGYQKRGTYYLTQEGDFALQEQLKQFIIEQQLSKKIKKTIAIGTSKGGYAALLYGLELGVDAVICGAPQYYLGNYLTDVPVKKPILEALMGYPDVEEEVVDRLNNLLPNQIKKQKIKKTKVYLHYSKKEHTYDEHIKYLINDLRTENYPIVLDEQSYEVHQEVQFFFPQFLINNIENEISKN